MSTDIRPEISKKSKWWISKHRYYELKHFCLQYREFRELYLSCIDRRDSGIVRTSNSEWGDSTYVSSTIREEYLEKMRMIEDACYIASNEIGSYIFKAVTEGLSYTCLKMQYEMPCSKDMFYDRYRKFFYILSRIRTQVTEKCR